MNRLSTRTASVVAVIQARMTSTRLPGKVLRPILGRPMLSLLLERLTRARTLEGLVIAMTTNAADDPLEALCRAQDIAFFRGDEQDVLGRFSGALAVAAPACEVVVRITSDCPLLDPAIVDAQVGWFLDHRAEVDYASVGKAPKLPNGASVEVFTRAALERAQAAATEAYDREHVTPWIQREDFRAGVTPSSIDAPNHRLSVDTPEDFALVCAVFEALYPANPDFTLADVISFLDAHPEVKALNAAVVQTTGPYAGRPG
jgi:spore coat polysaccharide biosynthesis protein SpsF